MDKLQNPNHKPGVYIKSRSAGRIRLGTTEQIDRYSRLIFDCINYSPRYRNLDITINPRTNSVLIESSKDIGLELDFVKTLESFGIIKLLPNNHMNRPSKNLLNQIDIIYRAIDKLILNTSYQKADLPIAGASLFALFSAVQFRKGKSLPAALPLLVTAFHLIQNGSIRKT